MPQDVRSELAGPGRQVFNGGSSQRSAENISSRSSARAVLALALGREQRCARPGVIVVELAPDILDEPAKVLVRAVDQRHQAWLRATTARAFAVSDVEFAEPTQLPPDIIKVQHPGLVDP